MIANITYGSDASELVVYLVKNRKHNVLQLRGVSSIATAAHEMNLIAGMNERAKARIMHVSCSAAIEDGVCSDAEWLSIADEVEGELGLRRRQRVIVRHRDKSYDHVHIFWCVIGEDDGLTPRKMWFRRPGAPLPEVGPCALRPEQVELIPIHQRRLKCYNAHALKRLMHVCRSLERRLNLKQLRTPQMAKAARIAKEPRPPRGDINQRAKRTGTEPLIERADPLRLALDAPDWTSKQRCLDALDVNIMPVIKPTKTDPNRVRGLVLVDRHDPGNRVRASDLDLPDRKYGLRQIEARHGAAVERLEVWWANRSDLLPEPTPQFLRGDEVSPANLRRRYQLYLAQHEDGRAADAAKRSRLKAQHAHERNALRRQLADERDSVAHTLPTDERRAFYTIFSVTRRTPEFERMSKAQRLELEPYEVKRRLTYAQFVAQAATAADLSTHLSHSSKPQASTGLSAAQEHAGPQPYAGDGGRAINRGRAPAAEPHSKRRSTCPSPAQLGAEPTASQTDFERLRRVNRAHDVDDRRLRRAALQLVIQEIASSPGFRHACTNPARTFLLDLRKVVDLVAKNRMWLVRHGDTLRIKTSADVAEPVFAPLQDLAGRAALTKLAEALVPHAQPNTSWTGELTMIAFVRPAVQGRPPSREWGD